LCSNAGRRRATLAAPHIRRITTDSGRRSPGAVPLSGKASSRAYPQLRIRLVKIIGQRAGLPLPVHFHMLRHSCGYKLANDGIDTRAIQDWLGHVSITHTTRYTQLSQTRFKDFWR
jgi:site-specific recombinase XerD